MATDNNEHICINKCFGAFIEFNKKKKQWIKDMLFMTWGFIGSCTLGSLFIMNDLGYLTGKTISETVDIINRSLSVLGLVFIVFLFAALFSKKIVCRDL